MDLDFILQTLQNNQDKGFVKRMYAPQPMTLDLGNGQHATHKMAWAEADGRKSLNELKALLALHDLKFSSQY